MITIADFRNRFSEFCDDETYLDSRIQLFLDDAELLYLGDSPSRWGIKYNIAHAYMAAHLLAISVQLETGDNTVKSGPVVATKVGEVSVNYSSLQFSNTSGFDMWLNKTTYGEMFLAIRKQCFVGVMTVC